MRCMLLWQSYAQLKHAYPTEAEVLMENSANLITFGHTAFSMSRQLADALGDISPERLFAMGTDELAVRRGGELTRIATRVDYLTDRELMGRAGRNPMFDHPASPRRASSNDASVGIL
jgi:TraM recognition site of TraD and TraG